MYKRVAKQFVKVLVVLNVDGSNPSGHPYKVLIIKRLRHFYFDHIKADYLNLNLKLT